MNHFFYEVSGKEKINSLRKEGMMSQAFHRSGARRRDFPGNLPKLTMLFVGILGLLVLLLH